MLLLGTASGCGTSSHSRGSADQPIDVGGHHLAMLAADPALTGSRSMPGGAQGVSRTLRGAQWEPGIDSSHWANPSVLITFRTNEPSQRVQRDVAASVTSVGWTLDTSSPRAPGDTVWSKSLPDGVTAQLRFWADSQSASPPRYLIAAEAQVIDCTS
jgi:hypothetical protein